MASYRRKLVRAIKAFDRRWDHRCGCRRVLVEVRTPMNLEVLRPLWEVLRNDGRVELTITAEEETSVRSALETSRDASTLRRRDTVVWNRFDLAMNADPWNPLPLRRCWRRIHLFHGVAGKYDLDDPVTLARAIDFRIYDRVLFPNEDRCRRYVSAGVVTESQAVIAGFAKADGLVNGAWNAIEVRRGLGLDPAYRTVLYAPTYSPASSVHVAGEAIVHALLDSGLNVIMKLHDRSMMPHAKFTGGEDLVARFAPLDRHQRFALARGAHAGPYLTAADMLVTDHSTVGFEFALLDRPIIVFDVPELLITARINPEKWRDLRAMADVVHRAEDLPAAVQRGLAEPWRHAARRRATARQLFPFAGHATDRLVAVAYELLELPPPPVASSSTVDTRSVHGDEG